MQKTILHISITVRGPLISQSANPGALGLDIVIARNHKNQIYLPGTLISGKIRQALEELDDAIKTETKPDWFAPDLNNWLGQVSENNFPKTKRLFFSDFVYDGDEPDNKTRYRIKIDSNRGAVEKHQIVMIESPFISGESYTFKGQVQFFSSKHTVDAIKIHINVGLKWLSHLGAFRSIGFGQVLQAEISDVTTLPISEPSPTNINSEINRIGLCIHPEHPFCLAGKPNTDNLFESEAIIPGGAIKGCIATTWNHLLDKQSGKIDTEAEDTKFKELRENFSKIKISHAFPGHIQNTRPVVAPFSLVKTSKEGPLYDVAQLTGPALINNLPPDFAVDWKDTQDTLNDYPWPYIRFKDWGWDSLESELRIRTAIDRDALRSAEEQLFAYQQIAPEKPSENGIIKVNWYSELDLSQIDNPQKSIVLEQLKVICSQGLIGLGKTKTPLQLDFLTQADKIKPTIPSYLTPLEHNTWLVTLQTDTLLGNPENLNETSGREELHKMYYDAWQEISNEKLSLLRYFARQKISGGNHRQHTMRSADNNTYRPWFLTEAGSVFVLQSNDTDADNIRKMLEDWLSNGLPLAKSAINWYRLKENKTQFWRYTPYVPENGYGEIAVNLITETVRTLKDTDTIVNSISGQEL